MFTDSPPPRRPLRSLIVLLCVGTLTALVWPNTASAQEDIGSLRARASRLADQLDGLEREAAIADEDYLETLDVIEKLNTEINTTQDSIAEAQVRVDEAEAQASEFLVAKYMDAGSSAALVALSNDDMNKSLNQQVLLGALRGDREELTDELAASRADLQDRKDELADKQSEVEVAKADQEAAKSRLEASISESQALYDEANGELQEAIAAEQRRREEEAARRAAAEAAQREAAQAAAAQQQAAAAPTTAAPTNRRARTAAPAAPAPAPGGGGAPAPAPAGGGAPAPAPTPLPPPPPPPPPPTSGGAAGAIQAAKTQLGRMYRWGGSSPATGFDCSGLMLWSWAQVGVGLPRTSRAQKAATQPISMAQIQPGDLVFYGNPVYHVGMYVGGGMMIDSPRTGKPVAIRPVGWIGKVSGVGRVR
ncbi:MAG: NlpC/P60 family protein [Microthrixaceae bacterium]